MPYFEVFQFMYFDHNNPHFGELVQLQNELRSEIKGIAAGAYKSKYFSIINEARAKAEELKLQAEADREAVEAAKAELIAEAESVLPSEIERAKRQAMRKATIAISEELNISFSEAKALTGYKSVADLDREAQAIADAVAQASANAANSDREAQRQTILAEQAAERKAIDEARKARKAAHRVASLTDTEYAEYVARRKQQQVQTRKAHEVKQSQKRYGNSGKAAHLTAANRKKVGKMVWCETNKAIANTVAPVAEPTALVAPVAPVVEYTTEQVAVLHSAGVVVIKQTKTARKQYTRILRAAKALPSKKEVAKQIAAEKAKAAELERIELLTLGTTDRIKAAVNGKRKCRTSRFPKSEYSVGSIVKRSLSAKAAKQKSKKGKQS